MEKFLSILKESAIFKNIEEGDLGSALSFVNAQIKSYKKNETVHDYNNGPMKMGIIVDGNCQIAKIDIDGNRFILRNLVAGNSFGDTLVFSGLKASPLIVTASTDCSVVYVSIKKIIENLSSAYGFQLIMIQNIIEILAQKSAALIMRNDILSKKTIRKKLLAFLDYNNSLSGKAFSMPFNQEELANYLAVNRSALSRELALMREEGILSNEKGNFVVKNQFSENEFK